LTAAAAEFLAQGKAVGLRIACDTTANAFVDPIWIAPAVRQGIGGENKELWTLSISCTLENTKKAAASVVAGIVTAATSSLACEHTVPKGTREPIRAPSRTPWLARSSGSGVSPVRVESGPAEFGPLEHGPVPSGLPFAAVVRRHGMG
jgi:hypothetical protein